MTRDARSQPPGWRAKWSTGKSLTLFLCTTVLLTAITSENPFHVDEQMQINEFAACKLGLVPREIMPWELTYEIRPWLMPAVATLAWRFTRWLGSSDAGLPSLLLRLVSGAFSLAAITRLAHLWRTALRPHHGSDGDSSAALGAVNGHTLVSRQRMRSSEIAQYFFVCTAGFIPYLSVRFSSEALSASLFILGLERAFAGTKTTARFAAFVAGLLWAGSFACRYQTALMMAGAALWLTFIHRASWIWHLRLVGGFLVGASAMVAIDAWGYGHLAFPFWGYLSANVLHGVAAAFSTEPFFAYLYLPVVNIFAISAAVTLVSCFVFWVRFPRHIMTWITAPSFILFSCMGHKEERFLFPLAILAAFMVVPAFRPDVPRLARLASAAARFSHTLLAKVLWGVNAVALLVLCIYPANWREHLPLARRMSSAVPALALIHLDESYTTGFHSYRRGWREREWQAGCPMQPGDYLLARNRHSEEGLEQLYTEWPFGNYALGLKVAIEDRTERFRERYGNVVQHISWFTLYRVTTATGTRSDGDPACAVRRFVPMSTEPPLKNLRL